MLCRPLISGTLEAVPAVYRMGERIEHILNRVYASRPPPSTLQIASLRQVVDDRLRSFYVAGARVQSLMLERLAAIFARLRTFELVEGSRRSLLPHSGVDTAPPSASDDGSNGDARKVDDSEEDGHSRDDERGSPLEGREDNSGDGIGVHETEVTRWLQFRTMDLVSFVGTALQAGDILAAAVVWRRHGRTDRGAAGRPDEKRAEAAEGRRLELALPAQLATVPAGAPPALLGAWLRDEVLPSLDVSGAVAVSSTLGYLERADKSYFRRISQAHSNIGDLS